MPLSMALLVGLFLGMDFVEGEQAIERMLYLMESSCWLMLLTPVLLGVSCIATCLKPHATWLPRGKRPVSPAEEES